MILTTSERVLVQQHIADLEGFSRLDQPIELRGKTLTNDQAHGVMIASLLLNGGAKLDQQSSDARTEDYLDAIEDLPAWSVREAIRKWNRAESPRLEGKPHSYDFRPSPPTLRRLALYEMIALRGRISELQKFCDAEPLIEYSDEHRKIMLERLADLFQSRQVDGTPATVGAGTDNRTIDVTSSSINGDGTGKVTISTRLTLDGATKTSVAETASACRIPPRKVPA